MSQKEIGDALLKLELATTLGDVDAQASQVMERERRRTKWLTRGTVGLWVLAAVGVLVLLVFNGLAFPMISKVLFSPEHAARMQTSLSVPPDGKLDPANVPLQLFIETVAFDLLVGAVSFAALVAAGLLTVLLIFHTRRATLRQIQSSLATISEQLKQFPIAHGGSGNSV